MAAEAFETLKIVLSDRYVIERELGRGGNAVVFLAHDQKHDRKVALKVLQPELALAVRAERFLREIQIAAKLSHPHILPLHDSGEAGGLLYYIMPYVEGEIAAGAAAAGEAAADRGGVAADARGGPWRTCGSRSISCGSRGVFGRAAGIAARP